MLLGTVSRDEGIVIRDYVALSLTALLDMKREGYRNEALEAIQRYQSLSRGRKATVGVTADQAVDIIQFQRTVRFFVDLYASTRLAVHEAAVGQSAAAAAPLSLAEYQRLSQALVRHQIFMRLHPGPDRSGTDATHATQALVCRRCFGLFAAWKMEQVAAAHAFVCSTHRAYTQRPPKPERIRDSGLAAPLHQSQATRRVGVFERFRLWTYLLDTSRLRQKVMWIAAADADLLPRMRTFLQEELGVVLTYRGQLDVLLQSHGFPKNEPSSELPPSVPPPMSERKKEAAKVWDALYRYEDAAEPLAAGTSAGEPPFGWVDALRGLDARRWGRDLPRCAPVGSNEAQHAAVRMRYAKWAWLGFVFWDKERVDLLKGVFDEWYKTGWVMDLWDSVSNLT
ncbi:subtilase [Apiospora marii]|uniref:Subtilase n=1 Tax=Apiospora marii TaxID=335849 RepID=A0ABR1RSV0_9PEZI